MAYDFEFTGGGDRIVFDSHGDFTTKVAVSLWVKVESNPGTNQTNYLIKTKSGANSDHNFAITWTPAGGGDIYILWHNPTTVANEWRTDYTPTVGAWTHFYFTIDWTTNPDTVSLWINGTSMTMAHNAGSNNVDPLTSATQVYYVGGPVVGDPNNTDGLIADIGVWSDIGNTARQAGLYSRSSMFYPENRVECMPLVNSPENLEGGTGTVTEAVLSTDRPPIVYPVNSIFKKSLRPRVFAPGLAR